MATLPATLGGATAFTTTLGAVTLAAQQRADMENGTFISSSEWTNMVNSSCKQLWEKLIEAYGADYEIQSAYQFTTDGINDAYAMPVDLFKLLGVDVQIADQWVTVWRFNFADRNRFNLVGIPTPWGRTSIRYRLRGGNLWLKPMPMSGLTFQVWYAPLYTPLSNSSDVIDGINGWEEWVINDVAMKARVKEESSIDDLLKLQQIQEDRLLSIVENRDAGSPAQVVDVYRANGRWGGDGWGPGDEWGP